MNCIVNYFLLLLTLVILFNNIPTKMVGNNFFEKIIKIMFL